MSTVMDDDKIEKALRQLQEAMELVILNPTRAQMMIALAMGEIRQAQVLS